MNVIVHPRVVKRHPQLTNEDVIHAFEHAYITVLRPDADNFPEYLWVGCDKTGRDVEMVGTATKEGWLIYHANTPLSKSAKREIGNL